LKWARIANNLAGKILGPLNTAGRVEEQVAVAKLTVRKHRDRAKRRAATDPTEKDPHLELANVEFQIAGKPSMALFRRQRDDV
jgi:hypothetical protein